MSWRRWCGLACISPALLFWLYLNEEYLTPGPAFSWLVFVLTAGVATGVSLLVEE